MHKAPRRALRPMIEEFEARLVASSGLGSPAHAVHAAKHHAAPKPKHPKPPSPAAPTPVVAPSIPLAPPPPAANPTGASVQAWVLLVNMTGQDLEYNIKLGPYQGGKFLPFDIAGFGPDSAQYRMSSLIVDGRRADPSFAIRFDNGPVIPLNTGPTAQAARGYYIFLGSNGDYYVSPFTRSGVNY